MTRITPFEDFFRSGEFASLDLSLSRIDRAIAASGIAVPDLGTVVHIAGTNGKGSTSTLLSHLLQKAGKRTALFTSPHIVSIHERIILNGTPVSDELFDEAFIRLKTVIVEYRLSFFEAVFLMALSLFAEFRPDVTILETGLGGTFDATNTGCISDKICVITSISMDHKEFLGSSIRQIVREKCNIVRGAHPVFVSRNKNAIDAMIAEALYGREIVRPLPNDAASQLYPSPFHENYATAKAVAEYITAQTLPDARHPLPPCRQERINDVIFDGAHNFNGIWRLVRSLKEPVGAVVVSTTKERDVQKLIDTVKEICDTVVLTVIPDNDRARKEEDMPAGYPLLADPVSALNTARGLAGGKTVLVTGSLYLCAVLRKHLLESKA